MTTSSARGDGIHHDHRATGAIDLNGYELLAPERARAMRAEERARERRIAQLLAIAEADRRNGANGHGRSVRRALRVGAGHLLIAVGGALEGRAAGPTRPDDRWAETATRPA